jgi:hypothetical protein
MAESEVVFFRDMVKRSFLSTLGTDGRRNVRVIGRLIDYQPSGMACLVEDNSCADPERVFVDLRFAEVGPGAPGSLMEIFGEARSTGSDKVTHKRALFHLCPPPLEFHD